MLRLSAYLVSLIFSIFTSWALIYYIKHSIFF